jgi:cell division septum initiation protein DivIVA
MSDISLANGGPMSELSRTDELLTELVEQVETARTLPMSSSVVLPRERVLDLLDDLREVLPPEIVEARKVVAARDALLNDAHSDAVAARDSATAAAELMLADGRNRADELIHDGEVRAYEIVEAGKAEHARLVSATGVHQSATAESAQLRADADAYFAELRDKADRYHDETMAEAQRQAMDVVSRAEAYASKLSADSDSYADRTLADLATTLNKAAMTAEQGRHALAQRRARTSEPVFDAEAAPATSAEASPDGPDGQPWQDVAASA